jgi:hypothetical protein
VTSANKPEGDNSPEAIARGLTAPQREALVQAQAMRRGGWIVPTHYSTAYRISQATTGRLKGLGLTTAKHLPILTDLGIAVRAHLLAQADKP